MLNNIRNNDELINKSLIQQQSISSLGLKYATNPYSKQPEFLDKTDISKEAIDLFNHESDITKFKNLVMNSIDEADANKQVSSLISNGIYQIQDEELADSCMGDEDLINMLFG